MNYHLIRKYPQYFLNAKNEHDLHSPFLYQLYTEVFLNFENFYAYQKLDELRKKLLKNHKIINVIDYGAGSKINSGNSKKISAIAKHGLTREKYAKLLFRLVEHFRCKNVVELGTSLGLTTLYLSAANKNTRVTTFEGCQELSNFAKIQAETFGAPNISFIEGNFDETFTTFLDNTEKVDFLFVDGNHKKDPTIKYFEFAIKKIHNDSVFVFDDIYWSAEMEEAWIKIKNHPSVALSVDIFQFGIVFFRKENKIKEDVTLRF